MYVVLIEIILIFIKTKKPDSHESGFFVVQLIFSQPPFRSLIVGTY